MRAAARAEAYRGAIDAMINQHLLEQYLDAEGVGVTAPEIDAEVENLRRQLAGVPARHHAARRPGSASRVA